MAYTNEDLVNKLYGPTYMTMVRAWLLYYRSTIINCIIINTINFFIIIPYYR